MVLPFRYQFILAPAVVVLILAALVGYTLVELSRINAANDRTVFWEILNDNIQSAITSGQRLDALLTRQPGRSVLVQDEDLFNYLEQTSIFADNLLAPNLLEQFPPELQQHTINNESLLRHPNRSDPAAVHTFVVAVLPQLEYQAKLVAAKRRSTYIDNHRALVANSSRLSTVLISTVACCIVLVIVLTAWGLHVLRQRFDHLGRQAQLACKGDRGPAEQADGADELDELEQCLVNMTARLRDVVSAENVLRGAEDERRRLAMDMHDGVLADLTAINRRLEQDMPPAELAGEINGVINQLRRTIDDLHPQVLDILGLDASLRSWLDRQQHQPLLANSHYSFDPALEGQLDLQQKINLYRIIIEIITNATKHAQADRLEISLRCVNNQLHASIEDNGIGIQGELAGRGHGYSNILERARYLKAEVDWHPSRFSSGTCFSMQVPLPGHSA